MEGVDAVGLAGLQVVLHFFQVLLDVEYGVRPLRDTRICIVSRGASIECHADEVDVCPLLLPSETVLLLVAVGEGFPHDIEDVIEIFLYGVGLFRQESVVQ